MKTKIVKLFHDITLQQLSQTGIEKVPEFGVSPTACSRYRLLMILPALLETPFPTSSTSDFSSSSRDAAIEDTLSLGTLNAPSTLASRFASARTSNPILLVKDNFLRTKRTIVCSAYRN